MNEKLNVTLNTKSPSPDKEDYWLNIYITYLFLNYDQVRPPKDNTLFRADRGQWLWFLNFDLEMWAFSFEEVTMWEFDGFQDTDPYYDTRRIYPEYTPEG